MIPRSIAFSLLLTLPLALTLRAQAPTRDEIRQMVREVLREELRQDATGATEEGLRSIVREEMRLLLQSEEAIGDDRVRGMIREVMNEEQDHERLDGEVNDLLAKMGDQDPFLQDRFLRIRISGLMQFRYSFTSRRDGDDRHAFHIPRARLQFNGNLTDDLSFTARGGFTGLQRRRDGFENRDGEFNLENFFATYRLSRDVVLTLGQMSQALMRQESFTPDKTQAIDYSYMYSAFTPGKTKAVQITVTKEVWRLSLSTGSGVRTINVPLDSSENADFAVSGRVELKTGGGGWARFDDYTSWIGSEVAALFGLGVHWEDGARLRPDEDSFDLFYLTADVGIEGDGWNLFAAFVLTRTDVFIGEHTTDLGFQLQGGLFLGEQWELFARGDAVFAGSERDLDDIFTATLGIHFYKNPRDFDERISLEILYVFGEVSDSFVPANENAGALASSEDGQFTLRVQWQVVF